ncbi:MAG TPA: adenylate/guanylate cyclase domain-containing protein [Ilumatobacteraceae bacterium]|nr:adenylate/guanylate cyclase domain-containing protein [Ilumatobacteraceae bacterium]
MISPPSPPTGDVTFLFTDIEGSTALWDRDPEAMTESLAEHDRRINSIVDAHNGYVFTTAGDSFAVAFHAAVEAVEAALEVQLAFLKPASTLDLKVRIGVHSGVATVRSGDYFGAAVNRGARLSASAHGGQLVLSQATVDRLAGRLPADVELADLGTHRLRGLAEPERIHQVNHPALAQEFPRLRTVEGPEDQLPTQLTSFIGRTQELRQVIDLVDAHRLVTLSGAGGAGKTRLAMRAAEELLGGFPDGLRVAELGAVRDADVLVEEIAQRFAVAQIAGTPLIRSVSEFIGDQRILLLLDNCEQIITATAGLCRDLLMACPNLHVLATSRERLGVAGEALYRVPSLSLPDESATVEEAYGHDSVRLFSERSRLASSEFSVTPDNVAAVVSICRHLDGIPLALELAAARTRSLSPAQILDRLSERFRLLTAADRNAEGRQRTLLSTIEWSHDLLGRDEQLLFRRLGVFAADFALPRAEHVCSGEGIDEFDVTDLLMALVDKSMVATDSAPDGTTRYLLLETLREFARRQLDEADERDLLQQRHAGHYAELAGELQVQQRAGDIGGALVRLDQEEGDFRASLRYSLGGRHFTTVAQLVGGLGYLWYAAGQHREGLQWCEELFALEPDLADPVLADALHSYASLLGVMGHPDRAVAVLEREVEIRRRLGDHERLGAALNNLGDWLLECARYEDGESALAEAVVELRSAGSYGVSLPLTTLAGGRRNQGRFADAERDFRDALAEARRADHAYSIAAAMGGLGRTLVESGQADAARPLLIEARERYQELAVTPGVVDAAIFLGLTDRDLGDPYGAARHLLEALTDVGNHWSDDAYSWTLQFTASIITDRATAAVLVGTVMAAYEHSNVDQPVFVIEDLHALRDRLETELDPDELGRHLRTGGRRTQHEAFDIARAALNQYIDEQGDRS